MAVDWTKCTTRSRTYPLLENPAMGKYYQSNTSAPYSEVWSGLNGKQVTVSEGHPFQSRSKKLKRDIGGPFFTTKQYLEGDIDFLPQSVVRSQNGVRYEYVGPIMASRLDLGWPPPFPSNMSSTDSQLETLGTTAIARCKPTNSVADVSNFLGELIKDGLPAIAGVNLWKERTSFFRGISSEFLNYAFGWKPFINDIEKFLTAVRKANTVLEQYERDAGKVVRRHYDFPEVKERTVIDMGSGVAYIRPYGFAMLNTTNGAPRGNFYCVREITRQQWFKGAFTYHLPTGKTPRDKLARYAALADKLFGLSLTPELIWNLAPWSWAIDWFANIGDILANVSDHIDDGLVVRYGYMMEHTIVKDTYTGYITSGQRKQIPEDVTLVTETKKRIPAGPYGFGTTWDGLSPFQLAILAALGITRAR